MTTIAPPKEPYIDMLALKRALNVIKAPFIHAGKTYNETAQKYPMYTGVVTTIVKTSAADMFAQKVTSYLTRI